MTQTIEDAGKVGKEYVDASLNSLAAMSKTMQTIAGEATEYARKSYETGSAALEKMLNAKTPEKAFEVQMEFGKQAYEGFVTEATRMADLYADFAKDAYKPFESVAVRSR